MTGVEEKEGLIQRVVRAFVTGPLSPLLLVVSIVVGAVAVLMTPREEEPQIVVPMADVFVSFPGASADEVEKLVATPLEKLLWQVDGVEHVYSVARRDSDSDLARTRSCESTLTALLKSSSWLVPRAGMAIAARAATMATTTISSTSVNARVAPRAGGRCFW